MEHQFHFDKKFYLDKKTGYWISTVCPKIRAHVWVWKYHNGNIPKGYHIHHKDGNKSNNVIENLQIMSSYEHLSLHSSDSENKKRASKWCDIIRPLTKAWHASKEGIHWHRQHGLRTWEERESFDIECKQCREKAQTKTYHQDFCSNKCKSAHRRQSQCDNIEKDCMICKSKFKVNKYAKTKTCGRKCGNILRNQNY